MSQQTYLCRGYGWASNTQRFDSVVADLMVVDRGTLSGTLVNDQRISEYGPLKLGDQIQIGSWTLRVDAFESPMVVDSSDEQAKIDRAVLKLRELIDLRRKDWQGASDAVVREECRELLAPIIADLLPDASAMVRHEFMARVIAESVGLGPLEFAVCRP